MPEDKNLDDLTDEEFDKLSDEGKIQPEESEEASQTDESQDEEKTQEEQEVEEDESEDDIEDVEDDVKDEAPLRTPHIPYSKHKKEKEKWAEVKDSLEDENAGLKKTIEDLESKLTKSDNAGDMNTEIEKFADKANLDKDTVLGLAEIIKKYSGVDEGMAKKMQELDELQTKLKQDAMFEDEYTEKALPGFESINPKAKPAQIKKAKARLTELAYDPKYVKVPMDMIVSHFKDEFNEILGEDVKKKTLEGKTKATTKVEPELSDDELAPEDWANMSDEEFDKRSERLADKSPSQLEIIRRGERIN